MYNQNIRGPKTDPLGTQQYVAARPESLIYGYILTTVRQIGFKPII